VSDEVRAVRRKLLSTTSRGSTHQRAIELRRTKLDDTTQTNHETATLQGVFSDRIYHSIEFGNWTMTVKSEQQAPTPSSEDVHMNAQTGLSKPSIAHTTQEQPHAILTLQLSIRCGFNILPVQRATATQIQTIRKCGQRRTDELQMTKLYMEGCHRTHQVHLALVTANINKWCNVTTDPLDITRYTKRKGYHLRNCKTQQQVSTDGVIPEYSSEEHNLVNVEISKRITRPPNGYAELNKANTTGEHFATKSGK
jgi:hypothetical protein